MRFGKTFVELEADAHTAIQEVLAEPFTHAPMKTMPNLPPQIDASRTGGDVIGVFSWKSKDVALGLEEMRVSSRDPHLLLHADQLKVDIRRGDRFIRCKNSTVFEVVQTQKDGYSGVDVLLVQIGRQS